MRKKRKAMALWKVILITISSIIGLVGVTVLALYLRGDLSDNPIYPESGIFYLLDSNEKYNSSLGVIESSENFSLTISTSTEDVNRRTVRLSLPNGVRENGYIYNEVIRVPETVQLDKPFQVELSVSPSDGLIAGGQTTITARSTYSPIDPVTITINVDTPVSEINAFCYDAEDAEREALSNIYVDSYFKIGVNYSPERSGKYFGRDEEKSLFYTYTGNNSIEFDPSTKTFHAYRVSQGTTDEITVWTFSTSEHEKAFYAQYEGDLDNFTELNTAALTYMSANDGSYTTSTISNIVVEEASVNSFVVTGTSFTANVDKNYHLALNSMRPEFDGNMGVIISNEKDPNLNSVYASGVGIALADVSDSVKISGGEVLKVDITAEKTAHGDGTYSYEFTYDDETGGLLNYRVEKATNPATLSPTLLPTEVNEDSADTAIATYYFLLPTRNVRGEVGNYNYTLSSSASTTANFISILFMENDVESGEDYGEYTIFLAEGQTFATLPSFTVNFRSSEEGEVYWLPSDEILRLTYDSDSGLSNSVELYDLKNVPTSNVYQEVKFFLLFDNGGVMPNNFTAIETIGSYQYPSSAIDVTIPSGPVGNTVYLYELASSNLSANSSYNGTLYLIFATVRTNADGEILNASGGIFNAANGDRYDIVMTSDVKSLEIDATLPFDSISADLSLNTAEGIDYISNGEILLPSTLTAGDTFTFSIRVDDVNLREQMVGLFNNNNLKIEFRTGNSVVDYISTVYTQSDEYGISGNVVVYDSFNSIDGVILTPYLVYDNGRQVQERALSVNYATGGAYNYFTLYRQSLASAMYAFTVDEETTIISPSADYPIIVDFNPTSTSIMWPLAGGGEEEIYNGDLSELNARLEVLLFDTHNRQIYTNVAGYTLTEIPLQNERVITINENQIMQFLSTDGMQVNTSVQATARNSNGTNSITLDQIYFTVQSEGVSRLEVDSTETDHDDPADIKYITYDKANEQDIPSTVTITKRLIENDFINMNNLVRVYREGENNPVTVTFKLNQADMIGYSSEDLNALFLLASEAEGTGVSNGIITLGGENATSSTAIDTVANRLENYTDDIYSFKMRSPIANSSGVRLVFDVTDETGLVNLKLILQLVQNIEYRPNLEAYANQNGYANYLVSGENSEIRVFGGDTIDLNTYLPIVINKEEQPDGWNGNLYVFSPLNLIDTTGYETAGASSINPISFNGDFTVAFKDVKEVETGSVTFYYKGYNRYGLSITVYFVISPNYVYVQNEDYVDVSSVNNDNLNNYYSLYRATEFLQYLSNGGDLPNEVVNSPYLFSEESGALVEVNGTSSTLNRVTNNFFSANIGTTTENIVSLDYQNGNITDTALALMFVKELDGTFHLLNEEEKYQSALTFRVGYGAENGAEALLNTIIDAQKSSDFSVQPTSTGYELTLLEGGEYVLNTNWTYQSENGENLYAGNNTSVRVIPNISSFNAFDTLTFKFAGDEIIVDTRMTKIGLDYVLYENDYDFDIITATDPSVLVENNVHQDYTAGGEYKILYFNDEVEEGEPHYGFNLIRNTQNSATYSLSVDIDSEYSSLITTKASDGEIADTIVIGNMIDVGEEVYAVVKLTFSIQINTLLTTDIYYRIRIVPNYTYDGDVTYPYGEAVENITDFTSGESGDTFVVDFNKGFNGQNSSNDVVNKTRFPNVLDAEGNVVENLTYTYRITSITVDNSTNYSDALSFDTDSVNNGIINNGVLVGLVLEAGRDKVIEIEVTRTIDGVANSEKTYHLAINSSPEYGKNVANIGGTGTLSPSGDDYLASITVGETYSYSIELTINEGGAISSPVTSGVNAHFTSDNGENYLKPTLRAVTDSTPITVYHSLLGPIEINTSNYDTIIETIFGADVDISLSELQNDIVVNGVTLSKDEYRVATVLGNQVYIRNEDINYFSFTQSGNAFILSFTTVDAIPADDTFSIGIYTSDANIFDFIFSIDGGYIVNYTSNLTSAVASGNDYNISHFIESISKDGGTVALDDLTYTVNSITTESGEVYTAETTDFVASDFVKVENDSLSVTKYTEDFSALMSAEIDGYTFTFIINFAKSFADSLLGDAGNLVINKESTLTIYAQDQNTLSVQNGDILSAIESAFTAREYVGVTGDDNVVDEFSFEDGEEEYLLTAIDVPESENFTMPLTLSYTFAGKEMFTFTISYNYTILPNVDIRFNYPNPQNTTSTNMTSEYVDNNSTFDNFFNSLPMFAGEEIDTVNNTSNRAYIEKLGSGDYTYNSSIYVDDIDNVRLVVDDNTEITTADSLVASGTSNSLLLPECNLTFQLIESSRTGTISFSIVVNEVIDYYHVTVSNTSVVRVETNGTNLVENNYERLYVEDIASDSKLYSPNRMLKYEYTTSASGSYVLLFTSETGAPFTETIIVDSDEVGVTVVKDLGVSRTGYTLQGIYKSPEDADNRENALTSVEISEIFSITPYLTNRIVLRYADYEVSSDVADVYFGDEQGYTLASDKEVISDLDTTETNYIYYSYSYDQNNFVNTSAFYSTLYTVKFSVETSPLNHYEQITVGASIDLLSFEGFGITNLETGENYTESDFAENNAYINLDIYGFNNTPIDTTNENAETYYLYTLHQTLQNGTASMAEGRKYETGLLPRYGMTELNSASGESTLNYLDITPKGTAASPNNYTINALGAGNSGNFVALRLTYVTVVGTKTYERHADLLIKVNPNYSVEFKSSNSHGGTTPGSQLLIGDKIYTTNINNPFNITLSGNETINLYSTSSVDDSAIRVFANSTSTNLSGTFTYTFTANTGDGYNEYTTHSVSNQGLYLSNWASTDGTTYTRSTTGNISIQANPIVIGGRSYYIDAVDDHGYCLRFYFNIVADINPTMELNTHDVVEGDTIEIGALYRNVSVTTGTVEANNGGSFDYNFSYTLTNVRNTNEPTIEVRDAVGAVMSSPGYTTRYFYTDVNGDTFLTDNFSTVQNNTDGGAVYLYLNTSEMKDDATIEVTYGGETLSPIHLDSNYQTPVFAGNGSGLEITMSGFNIFSFTKTENADIVPIIPNTDGSNHLSNVNNITISSIVFEVDGVTYHADGEYNAGRIESGTTQELSKNLITAERYMVDIGEDLVYGYSAINANRDDVDRFRIPTLPGHLYGTSTVVDDVTMIITLSNGTDSAELRTTISISRPTISTLNTTEFYDTQSVTNDSFNSSITAYNNTLEIELAPNTSVEYAISSSPNNNDLTYVTASGRSYAHIEYARIAPVGEEFDPTTNNTYYIHLNSSLPEGVTFKYGGVEIEFSGSTVSNPINVTEFSQTNALTLRIESVSELNLSNFAQRNFYSVILSNGKYYQHNHTINLYALANEIATPSVTVNDYYAVTGASGTYYVISASAWAGNLTYSRGNNSTGNLYPIANQPYYYSYAINDEGQSTNRGVSVDSMGTITTGTNVNIYSYSILVDVILHVSGADGTFETTGGINLGTVTIRFRNYDSATSSIDALEGVYLFGSGAIGVIMALNNESVSAYGNANLTSYSAVTQGNNKTIVVPVGESVNFADYLDPSGTNSTYRLVREGAGASFNNIDNENSHTYSSASVYNSVFVESYVSGNSINYRQYDVTVIACNTQMVTEKAFAVAAGSNTETLGGLLGASELYLMEDVESGIFASGALDNGASVASEVLSSTESKEVTLRLAENSNGTITYYEVRLYFYNVGENYDVAISPNSSGFDLYDIFENASAIYSIDNGTATSERYPSISGEISTTVNRTYYVVSDTGVSQHTITYYLYSQREVEDRIAWYGEGVTREEVIASMLNEELAEGEIYSAYTLYQLSSAGVLSEVGTNEEITMGTLNNNRANINFLLVFTDDATGLGVTTYQYFIFTFYHYTTSANFEVATSYTTTYSLSTLNSMVAEEFGETLTGTVSWYSFENGDIISQAIIELSSMQDSNLDGVIEREFYVNINNKYYFVTINFHLASQTYNDSMTTSNTTISLGELRAELNGVLAENDITVTENGTIYLVTNNKMEEISSLTLEEGETSFGTRTFLYKVSVDGNSVNYLFNLTIIMEGGTQDLSALAEGKVDA